MSSNNDQDHASDIPATSQSEQTKSGFANSTSAQSWLEDPSVFRSRRVADGASANSDYEADTGPGDLTAPWSRVHHDSKHGSKLIHEDSGTSEEDFNGYGPAEKRGRPRRRAGSPEASRDTGVSGNSKIRERHPVGSESTTDTGAASKSDTQPASSTTENNQGRN